MVKRSNDKDQYCIETDGLGKITELAAYHNTIPDLVL